MSSPDEHRQVRAEEKNQFEPKLKPRQGATSKKICYIYIAGEVGDGGNDKTISPSLKDVLLPRQFKIPSLYFFPGWHFFHFKMFFFNLLSAFFNCLSRSLFLNCSFSLFLFIQFFLCVFSLFASVFAYIFLTSNSCIFKYFLFVFLLLYLFLRSFYLSFSLSSQQPTRKNSITSLRQ